MLTTRDGIRTLSSSLIEELAQALALPKTRQVIQLVRLVFGRAAQRFAELAVGLDQVIAENGTAAAARWLLPRFAQSYAARGLANVPASGPLVIASNHPGSFDSVVISAHVRRPDYKLIIGDIPFFQKLPHISQHAIFAPSKQDLFGRMGALRESIRHLASGGALLIFARGGIEPDPDFMPGPGTEFDLWSPSLKLFFEHVPQTRVLVTVVSGVISQLSMRHPITWLRRKRPDKQRLAFMLQMAQQVLIGNESFGLTPRLSFGEVIGLDEAGSPAEALECIKQSAGRLLTSHLVWLQEAKHANI